MFNLPIITTNPLPLNILYLPPPSRHLAECLFFPGNHFLWRHWHSLHSFLERHCEALFLRAMWKDFMFWGAGWGWGELGGRRWLNALFFTSFFRPLQNDLCFVMLKKEWGERCWGMPSAYLNVTALEICLFPQRFLVLLSKYTAPTSAHFNAFKASTPQKDICFLNNRKRGL